MTDRLECSLEVMGGRPTAASMRSVACTQSLFRPSLPSVPPVSIAYALAELARCGSFFRASFGLSPIEDIRSKFGIPLLAPEIASFTNYIGETPRINRQALTTVSGAACFLVSSSTRPTGQRLTDWKIMAEEEYLRTQANQCRWLASHSAQPRIVATLRDMARDYEAKAAALATR